MLSDRAQEARDWLALLSVASSEHRLALLSEGPTHVERLLSLHDEVRTAVSTLLRVVPLPLSEPEDVDITDDLLAPDDSRDDSVP